MAGYNDGDWNAVSLLNHDLTTLVAPAGPPVRRTQEIVPVAITTSPSGKTLVDFGQNLAGRVRFTVRGAGWPDDYPAPRGGAGKWRTLQQAIGSRKSH